MSAPTYPRWLVADRREGATTALLAWLLAGRRRDTWPGWSRLLVVRDAQELHRIRRDHPDIDQALRIRGAAGGLGKLVLTPGDVGGHLVGRGRQGVEFAVDDRVDLVDRLRQLGCHVAIVATTGTTTTPADLLNETWQQRAPVAHPTHLDGEALGSVDLLDDDAMPARVVFPLRFDREARTPDPHIPAARDGGPIVRPG